jgi:murein L,D-transpeptidase YcbB/YkuD
MKMGATAMSGGNKMTGLLARLATAAGLACLSAASAAAASPADLSASALAPDDAAHWSAGSARQLLRAIAAADREGLSPRDYRPETVRAAIASGEGPALDAVADGAALALAHDYLFGRVSDRQAMGWLIERSPYEAIQLPAGIRNAMATGTLDRFLAGLLPADRRYAALRDALADASDPVDRARLRANMERARWLPRTAERNYLYVNVPSYRLAVVADGQPTSTYTVVVGAKDTPTPQMISPTSSLVVNPWWNVPQSIVRKSNMRPGRAGFQFTRLEGGQWAVRQPPGPRNALGRIKFNLVNDQAIYLHDTPAKSGFARDERALSHGCIRVKNIDRLAAELMEPAGSDETLDTALAGSQTATLRLPQTWPVYIVYFTADVGSDGALETYADPYGYDSRIVAALDGPVLQVASRD